MRKLFTLVLLVLVSLTLPAQLNYNFSTSTGNAYVPVAGGTLFNWATGTGIDDRFSVSTPIGFSFNYNGVPYDSFQVSTNGFITLGNSLLTTSIATNALWGTQRNVIAPLWDDLSPQGPDSLRSITYLVTGTPGNLVLTVDWRDQRWDRTATAANANFQVRLFQATGRIEMVYGRFGAPILGTTAASIGLTNEMLIGTSSAKTGQMISLNIGGIAGARTYHASMGFEFTNIRVAPDSGTVIRFDRVVPTPIVAGTYTIGGASPTFATLSQAALAINVNGVAGPVVFNIRAGTYDDIFHLINVPGTSATNRITVQAETGATVTLSPINGGATTTSPGATAGDAIVRLDGTDWTTIQNLSLVDNAANLTTVTKFEMGVFLGNSLITASLAGSSVSTLSGARFNTLANLIIDLNATTPVVNVGTNGIRFGSTGTATDTTTGNSWNTIRDVNISDCIASGIHIFSFSSSVPDRGNRITATGANRNIVGNISTSTTALDLRGIQFNGQRDFLIEKTDIVNITNTGAATQSIHGILVNPSSSILSWNFTISDVNISNLQNTNATATTNSTIGIFVGVGGTTHMMNNSVINIDRVNIHNLFSSATSTGSARGIAFATGTGPLNLTVNITNCFISDLSAPTSTLAGSVRGIDLQFATFMNVYNNTVYLDGPVTLATHQSAGIHLANVSTSNIDLRNNVVVNNMAVGSGVSRAVALFSGSAANLARLTNSTNNNLYFAGTPSAKNLIHWDGTNVDSTLAMYRSRVGVREVNSVTELPPFVNTATKPYNLRLSTTVPTQANNMGTPLASVTTDFFGTARSATTPDLGAHEFTGITGTDVTPPTIAFTVLPNDNSLIGRSVTARITDLSGLATGVNGPRLYFRKIRDAVYQFVTPTASGNDFTFSFQYSNLPAGSVVIGDTIEYYLAAQDLLGNGTTVPSTGSGINPPGTTAPTTPLRYLIIGGPLSGNYVIGLGTFRKLSGRDIEVVSIPVQNSFVTPATEIDITNNVANSQNIEGKVDSDVFEPMSPNALNGELPATKFVLMENGKEYTGPTVIHLTNSQIEQLGLPNQPQSVFLNLTAAVTEFNTRGVSGPVTFLLNDTLMNEVGHASGQLLISGNATFPTSTVNTLTIRTQTGVNTRLNFSSTSAGIFVGTSNVVFNGSNTPTGTTRNLTITNTGVGASAGVAFVSLAHNVVFRNLIAQASASAQGYGFVYDASINGIIENCIVRRTALGIQAQSNSRNFIVRDNFIGSTIAAEKIQNLGVSILSTDGFTITRNNIVGLLRGAVSHTSAVLLGVQTNGTEVVNGTISRNFISDIKHSGVGAGAYGAHGLRLSGWLTNSNILIANNVLTDIRSDGDAGFLFNAHGIYITDGGGYRIVNNSINLFGNLPAVPATAPMTGAITIGTASGIGNIEVINNSIVNNFTFSMPTGRAYLVYSLRPSVGITVSNNNNLFTNVSQGRMAFVNGIEYVTPTDWMTATGLDLRSVVGNPAYTDTLNLSPNPALADAWTLNGNGLPLADVTVDFLGNPRSSTIANGATDIGAFEFTPTAAAPNATPSGAPVASGTQTFTHLGRTLGSITWGSGGVVPTDVTFQLVSGTNPPSAPAGFQFGNHYWIVNATGGSGFTYSITFNYQTNSLGAAVENQLRVGKRDAGVWNGNILSSVNTVNKTITATGLLNFSDFAIYSGTPSDPDTLIAINAGIRRINLLWRDNSNNETGFEIQRKLGDIVSPNAYVVVATVPPNTQTYADTSLEIVTQYTYRVRAINPFVNSGFSNQAVIVSLIPVELTSFAATTEKQTVNLTWVTATEKNNQGFEVERLMNGEWEKIAFVEGKGTVLSPTSYSYTDNFKGITHKGRIEYRLRQIDFGGAYEYSNIINVDVDFTPKEFALAQNYPNPFNPTTRIEYQIPNDASVKIELYSISGEKVADLVNTELKTGFYVVDISASSLKLSSGVYIYRMIATEKASGKQFVNVKRMMLIK